MTLATNVGRFAPHRVAEPMTIEDPHRDRIDAGVGFDWELLPPFVERPDEIAPGSTDVRLQRVRASHRGIAALGSIVRLWAYAVDHSFLDEICRMLSLELLYLEHVTATDLSGLGRLSRLTRLIVVDATKVEDLDWVPSLDSLEALALENFKRVHDLSPLARLTRLRALGIEGSLWTPMRVATLRPLSDLPSLEALFLTNLRVADRSLEPLHGLRRLRVLQCAKFFPRVEFQRLENALPDLRCQWFDARWWS
jgi:hypothetical protein